jgi:uncharacterized protein (UPF0276 family)
VFATLQLARRLLQTPGVVASHCRKWRRDDGTEEAIATLNITDEQTDAAMTMPSLAATAGIGLRQPHYRQVFEQEVFHGMPAPGFLEVHSENFFLEGGASMRALDRARALYPISLHGVGLSLGSVDRLAEQHLGKLKTLIDRVEPALVSEHLCWGRVDGTHFNDLLPLPHTHEALWLMADRIDKVQSTLKRRILVENVSAYVEYRHHEMSETAFLAELSRRTGCGILLDLNNLYVNAINFGFDAAACLEELTESSIGEIHLAGHTRTDDCLIDTHGSRVCDEVWSLYAEACRRFGRKPTLIEWDTDLPTLDVLLGEAAAANEVARSGLPQSASLPSVSPPAASLVQEPSRG